MPAPGTPEHIVGAWKQAIDKMIRDPEFVKAVDPLMVGASWMSGEDFSKSFRTGVTKMDTKVIEWLRVSLAEFGAVLE
ncbi:MAG: hypothetical protein HYX90_00210 [Chloroflexi bacterium]|nr:hypothetical protein [Chloroflexota bacterium]